MAFWLTARTSVLWPLCVGLTVFTAACVDRVRPHDDVTWLQGHSSQQRTVWHHVDYCGSGCGNVSAQHGGLHWESLICIAHFDKWSGGETGRTFDTLADGHMTYSDSRRGCSSSGLAGSAGSNDLQPPGGRGNCGLEDGRWSAWKPACIHTSDSPDSWRNQSTPPKWMDKEHCLNSESCCSVLLCISSLSYEKIIQFLLRSANTEQVRCRSTTSVLKWFLTSPDEPKYSFIKHSLYPQSKCADFN